MTVTFRDLLRDYRTLAANGAASGTEAAHSIDRMLSGNCLGALVDKESACHQNAENGRLVFQAQLLRGYLNSNALPERIFLLVTLLPRSWPSLH
jgi:hypothetical protein